jgi:cytoplasmic iron level regulating protein YaaA (DUF328/UPF0246 family)
MLVAISPAKSLDWDVGADAAKTEPAYQADALRLAKTSRGLTLGDLKKLMSISDDLARLNRDRFKAFQAEPDDQITRPAALAFNGDTYQGLQAGTFDDAQMSYAQDHLRILSGLYGLLRPMDAIQPYRLEMGSRLKTRRGNSLYAYWGDMLAKDLNRQGDEIGARELVNCASQEYFGAVDLKALKLRVVTPVFLEEKNGTAKTVSFFAKRARGAMARFMITEQVRDAEALKAFDLDGYAYRAEQSDEDRMVFSRPYPTK